MPRVVHFEISADDPARASKFYGEVFGWEFQKWEGPEDYWLVKTGADDQPGINGGLLPRRGGMTCVNTVDVPSVDDFIDKITGHGGEVVVPKMAVPGIGYLAYGKDTEGNIFGIMQEDTSAQ